VRVLCLRNCTGLKPSVVRRMFLQKECAGTLKLDLRGCPALYSLQVEFKEQVHQNTKH
jgi:hypothetical protein